MFDSERVDLTYHEFLLAHNKKSDVGDIYSFRGMSTPVVLEP